MTAMEAALTAIAATRATAPGSRVPSRRRRPIGARAAQAAAPYSERRGIATTAKRLTLRTAWRVKRKAAVASRMSGTRGRRPSSQTRTRSAATTSISRVSMSWKFGVCHRGYEVSPPGDAGVDGDRAEHRPEKDQDRGAGDQAEEHRGGGGAHADHGQREITRDWRRPAPGASVDHEGEGQHAEAGDEAGVEIGPQQVHRGQQPDRPSVAVPPALDDEQGHRHAEGAHCLGTDAEGHPGHEAAEDHGRRAPAFGDVRPPGDGEGGDEEGEGSHQSQDQRGEAVAAEPDEGGDHHLVEPLLLHPGVLGRHEAEGFDRGDALVQDQPPQGDVPPLVTVAEELDREEEGEAEAAEEPGDVDRARAGTRLVRPGTGAVAGGCGGQLGHEEIAFPWAASWAQLPVGAGCRGRCREASSLLRTKAWLCGSL